jgi:hypothetical protein
MGKCFFVIPFYSFSLDVRRKRTRLFKKQEALLGRFIMDDNKTSKLFLLCQMLAMRGIDCNYARTQVNHSMLPFAFSICMGACVENEATRDFYKFDDEYG